PFEVFESRDVPDNILVFSGYGRASAIMVGQNVLTQMRPEDLDHALKLALHRIEKSNWAYACTSTMLLSLLALPMLIMGLFGWSAGQKIVAVPSDTFTKSFWKLGRVKNNDDAEIVLIKEAYSRIWRRTFPQVHKVLQTF